MKNIEIHVGGRLKVVPKNVLLFEGDANYSHVHFKNGRKITVATTLKELEKRFESHNFYRSHKKYLINLREVNDCERYEVALSNHTNVLVSRRKKEGLLTIINKAK